MDETGNSQVADGDEPQNEASESETPDKIELSLSADTWKALAQIAAIAKTDGEALEQFLVAVGQGYTVSVTLKQ